MGSTAAQSDKDYPLYVVGQPVETGEWLEAKNKYSHERYARVALANAETLEKAIHSATQAEAEMAALEPFQKQKILLHCVSRFKEIRAELKGKLVQKLQLLKAGDPNLETTLLGPMIKEAEAKRLHRWLEDAVAQALRC